MKYFVVAVDCNSFSEAAKVLYTSQPNISKVISNLEDTLGYSLMQRDKKGIVMTPQGRKFYKEASVLLAQMEKLEESMLAQCADTVRIATNPSSWFALHFSNFFGENYDGEVSFDVHTDDTFHLVERMSRMEDELSFLYLFPEDQAKFDYEVKKAHLSFEPLGEVPWMLYHSAEDDMEYGRKKLPETGPVYLIQGENDLYVKNKNWNSDAWNTPLQPRLQVAVTTNSDYIMNIMLKSNGLCNISPESFAGFDGRENLGIRLTNNNGNLVYGCLTNPALPLSPLARKLKEYIKKQIKNKNYN